MCSDALALAEVARQRDRVSLVPGNHDRYVAAPFDATVGLWRDYFRGDSGAADSRSCAAATASR